MIVGSVASNAQRRVVPWTAGGELKSIIASSRMRKTCIDFGEELCQERDCDKCRALTVAVNCERVSSMVQRMAPEVGLN